MADGSVPTEFKVPANLIPRCARYFRWNDATCQGVLKAYRQFMELKVKHEDWDATILSPPSMVNLMWHDHTLDARHYAMSCTAYCGHLIGHDISEALDGFSHLMRVQTTQISAAADFGKEQVDSEIWSFGFGTPTSQEYDSNNKRARCKDEAANEDPIQSKRTTQPIVPFPKFEVDPFWLKFLGTGPLRVLPKGERIPSWILKMAEDGNNEETIDFSLEHGASEDDPIELDIISDSESALYYSGTIIVRVLEGTGKEGEEVFFRIKQTSKMSSLFEAFVEHKVVCASSVMFLLEGESIKEDDTPLSLKLKDHGHINAMINQSGCLRIASHVPSQLRENQRGELGTTGSLK